MIGPVQLLMIGFQRAEMPVEVRQQIEALRSNPAVQVLGVRAYSKGARGDFSHLPVEGLTAEQPAYQEEDFIKRLLTKAGASATVSDVAPSGRGYLMRGDRIPDVRRELPANTNVVILMLEHRWANQLRDAVRDSDAFPLADLWLGRQSIKDIALDPEDH
jgi:hypothetical protein